MIRQMKTPTDPTARKLSPAVWIATGLGVGLVSPAPGTVGALWGLPWAWAVLACPEPLGAWASVLVGILVGVPLCGRAARDLGGQNDPGAVVWDEIATVPLVFLLTPQADGWLWLLVGFALHRLFDISKPWPCRRLERLPGGLGIMIDDVMAALYAAVVLRIVWQLATSG